MIAFSSLLALGSFAAAALQEAPAEAPKVELKLEKAQAAPGGSVKGKVVITFSGGWHGYQNPPKNDYEIPLKVEGATKGLVVKPTYPKGVLKTFTGTETLVYEGSVAIPVVVTFPKQTGTFSFQLKVSYQQCDENACLPLDKVMVSGKVLIKKPKSAQKR